MGPNYHSFRNYATIFMSGMTGVIIAYPFALSLLPSQIKSLGLLFTAFLVGLLIGYRRRDSRAFLYFCMLAILILAAVTMFSANV